MEIPRHWRLKKQRYGLVGTVCKKCEKPTFPPREICPTCGGTSDQRVDLDMSLGSVLKMEITLK